MENEKKNAVLTIAGSDSSGGAGIQADIKTFEEFNERGLSCITAITSQNPKKIIEIHEVPLNSVESQLTALFDYYQISFVKTGMLFSKDVIEVIEKFHNQYKFNLIIDPIFKSSSGTLLLKEDAREVLLKKLIPKAFMLTPNVIEAEIILSNKIYDLNSQVSSAKKLLKMGVHSVLLKGGHLTEDLFYDILIIGNEIYKFPKKRKNRSLHGSGCKLSAAIVANLNKGLSIFDAVSMAEKYIEKLFEMF